MRKTTLFLVLTLALAAVPSLAQDPPRKLEQVKSRSAEKIQMKAPDLKEEARLAVEAGIPEEDVKMVTEQAREKKLKPEETAQILRESRLSCEENGPVKNYGDFVKAKLDEGLRGKDLAKAIREEHRLHGQGKAARAKSMGEDLQKKNQEKAMKKGRQQTGKGEEKQAGKKARKEAGHKKGSGGQVP